MTTWKITTEHKKSIVQTEYWKNLETGQKITYNLGWRWGEYYVVAPKNTTIEEWLESYDEDEGVSVFDEFEVEDSSEDDGCWVDVFSQWLCACRFDAFCENNRWLILELISLVGLC